MTIIAGILGRSPDNFVSPEMREELSRLISRYPQDQPIVSSHPQCVLAKIDIHAFGTPAYRADENGSISLLAGEPLLSDRTRAEDLALIHQACEESDWTALSTATGTFCVAHYSPRRHRLTLVSDKLCIRPLYYYVGEHYVCFASALRILEGMPWIPKTMDLRAVTEMTTIGVPLSTRTPYTAIKLMDAGSIVQVAARDVRHTRYWRWDTIPQTNLKESDLLKEAATRFTRAITRRNQNDRQTLSFLSGGLDSRCIVAVLRSLQIDVVSFNLAPPDTLDQALGARFAMEAGTHHYETPMDPDLDSKYSSTVATAWTSLKLAEQFSVPRPRLVWSGDGGSVGVGHVYITPEVVNLLRAGELDAAIQLYLNREKAWVLKRLFPRKILPELLSAPTEGVLAELNSLQGTDAGKRFYLYLMLNDQRRHLAEHFEHIDLHRTEFQLPYYDSHFLSLMVSVPIDLGILHRFYNKWLAQLPPSVLRVPWQAYPGHEPCPLPVPTNLTYQWGKTTYFSNFRASQKAALLRDAAHVLSAHDFPQSMLNRHYLQLTTLLHRFGLREYSHVLQVAKTYYRYSKACSHTYSFCQSPTGTDLLPLRYSQRGVAA